MPLFDVKITDLELYNEKQIKEEDLFLLASLIDEYFRNYYSATTYLSSIASLLVNKPREVSAHWVFDSGEEPPIQTTRFDPRRFFNDYVLNKDNIDGVINLSGHYADNETFFPIQFDPKDQIEAIDSSLYSFANLDYVNKITAAAHKDLLELFNEIPKTIYDDGDSVVLPSFVGTIVFTTKNYANDNALRAIYGDGGNIINDVNGSQIVIKKPDTHWVRHSGQFVFRCTNNTSKVKASSLDDIKNKDGGSNDPREVPLKSHGHSIKSSHHHSVSGPGKLVGSVKLVTGYSMRCKTHKASGMGGDSPRQLLKTEDSGTLKGGGSVGSGGAKISNTDDAGGGQKLDIKQAFKNVYVWERVS